MNLVWYALLLQFSVTVPPQPSKMQYLYNCAIVGESISCEMGNEQDAKKNRLWGEIIHLNEGEEVSCRVHRDSYRSPVRAELVITRVIPIPRR